MPEPQDVRLGGSLVNRTGIAASPHREAMTENTSAFSPTGTVEDLHRHRIALRREAPPVGTMPPPTSISGAAREAVRTLKGEKTTVLLDKLGERLAFERTGTRLYDTLLEKHEAYGSWDGGPSREDLARFREEEARHFRMLAKAMKDLDADPTAVTPSADVAGLASSGVLAVIADERTRLGQGIEAILIAELVDRDGWKLLIELAERLGQEELARSCREAEREEERHLESVRVWVKAHVLSMAK